MSIFAALWRPRRATAAVSSYGKLPIYKDFIRQRMAGREAKALRRWLDRGISHLWEAREEYREHEISPHGFLLSFPGGGPFLLGYLWGSFDQGGLRSFPFTFFIALGRGRGRRPPAAMLAALEQVVEQAAELRRKAAGDADVETLQKRLRSASFEVLVERVKAARRRLVSATAEVSTGRFAASLYGEDWPRQWPALLAYLRSRADDSAGALAARLPASGLLPLSCQAELWCTLLADWGARRRTPLNVFYALEQESAGIMLLGRELRPDDVFVLHPEMPGYELVEDLRHAVPGAAGEALEALPPEQRVRPLSALLDS